MLKAVVTIFTKDGSLFDEVVEFKDEQEVAHFAKRLHDSGNPFIANWVITQTETRSVSKAEAEQRLKRDFGITLQPAGKKEWWPD